MPDRESDRDRHAAARRRASSTTQRIVETAKGVAAAAAVPVSWVQRYEVPRKTLHSSIGFVVVGAYCYTSYRGVDYGRLLVLPCAIVGAADVLRFNNARFARFYESKLGTFMRPAERFRGGKRWNGVLWYLLGTITVLLTLPEDLAVLSILLLSWCDTAASTAGRAYGSLGPQLRKGKSLVGTLAACATGAVTTYAFFRYMAPFRADGVQSRAAPSQARLSTTQFSFLGGAIAAFAEFIDVLGADDNFVIPVVAGGLLYAAASWLGW